MKRHGERRRMPRLRGLANGREVGRGMVRRILWKSRCRGLGLEWALLFAVVDADVDVWEDNA